MTYSRARKGCSTRSRRLVRPCESFTDYSDNSGPVIRFLTKATICLLLFLALQPAIKFPEVPNNGTARPFHVADALGGVPDTAREGVPDTAGGGREWVRRGGCRRVGVLHGAQGGSHAVDGGRPLTLLCVGEFIFCHLCCVRAVFLLFITTSHTPPCWRVFPLFIIS